MKRKGMILLVFAMAGSILFGGSLYAKEKTKVAIVFATGGLGDKSFNDSAMEGIKQAINKYGAFLGTIKGALRIMRCNPFSKGGYDPVR